MPNYIANRITAAPEVLKKIAEAFKTDEAPVDFNAFVKMPDDIFRGNLSTEKQAETKSRNLYDWSVLNWGTRWNACRSKVTDFSILFSTVWSIPSPIIEALRAKKLGDWKWEFADGNIGSNCGVIECEDNNVAFSMPDDAIGFALELHDIPLEERDMYQ